jgi:uncharacterized protein (DUF1330 family)
VSESPPRIRVEVVEINVTDQPTYEASGVDKVRDGIKASGAKLLAGGYNKTQSYDGAPVANRYLIFQFPSKEADDKFWKESAKPWAETVKNKSMSTFRVIGVEVRRPFSRYTNSSEFWLI